MDEYLKDEDVQLMLRFKDGDNSSFEILLEKYQSPIINFLYKITGNKTEAEDLTQEVFIRVYHSGKKYIPQSKFSTWIYIIAKNTALNDIRRKKGILRFLKKDLEEPEKKIPDNKNPSALAQLELKDLQKVVKNAIDLLPPNQKIAVILSKYDSLSYEEISQIMDCSISSVKSLLNRAKISLKEKLEKYVYD
ncbi:MAG: RNA polymerase sigma factor [bacterium]